MACALVLPGATCIASAMTAALMFMVTRIIQPQMRRLCRYDLAGNSGARLSGLGAH